MEKSKESLYAIGMTQMEATSSTDRSNGAMFGPTSRNWIYSEPSVLLKHFCLAKDLYMRRRMIDSHINSSLSWDHQHQNATEFFFSVAFP